MQELINQNYKNFYFLIFIFSIVAYIFFNVAVLNDPILVQHGFRQTHNALVSYYLIMDGFSFSYEAPNWGEPWSVPHEFPMYQWVVAQITTYLHIPLTVSGRILSLISGLLVCIPIFHTLKILKIKKETIFLCLSLILSAPTFIYWSGTFMIETSALFFSCCFIFFIIKISLGDRKISTLIFSGGFLSLAMLQKITTAFPVLLVMGLVLLIYLIKNQSFTKERIYIAQLAISLLIPCLIFLAWFLYADYLKSMNPLMSGLTLTSSIDWYFGTLKDRASSQLWLGTIFESTIIPSSGILIGFISFMFFILKNKDKKLKLIIFVSLLLFLVPFLIHTKVHINHKYYQVANIIFWSIISGLCINYFIDYLKLHNNKKIFLILFVLLSNYLFFCHKYFFHYKSQIQEHNKRTIILGEYIKSNTDSNKPIVIFGYGGSSTLTFYSERKAISLSSEIQAVDVINNIHKYLSKKPSSFILCPYKDSKGKAIDTYDKNKIKELIYKNFNSFRKNKIILDCEIIYD